jgi:hypothetical protein
VSLPDGIVAAQLQGLLQRLDEDRERRCGAELASAQERAKAITRAARDEARRRMREAVYYERTRRTEGIALRRAELEAARRREEHAVMGDLVLRACERLPAVLDRRWRESGARCEWCEAALAAAAQRLCGTDWQIEIAPGTSAEEREALLARASIMRAGTHSLSECTEFTAGLRVRATGAILDATVDGLLDDIAAIGARFLHEWLRSESLADAGAAHA